MRTLTLTLLPFLLVSATPMKPEIASTLKTLRQIETAALKGDSDALRISFQDQSRDRPSDFMLRVYAAWCLGKSNEAWNTLRTLANMQRESPWPHLGMARIFVSWKMKDQARPELEKLLRQNPQFYPALTVLGQLELSRGEHAAAEKQFRAALAIADDGEARAGLGLALLAQEEPGPAKVELEKAIALYPEQPEALSALISLSKAAGDPAGAARSAEKLTGLAPRDAKARRTLADLRLEAGDKPGAAKEYEALQKLGGWDETVLEKLVGLHRELGNADGEERALKQLATLKRQESAYPLRLAELAEARGSVEDAEAQLVEAAARAPKRAEVHARLGKFRLGRGQLRQALDELRLARTATEGDNPESLDADLAALSEQLQLPKKPASGSVDQIYKKVSTGLNAVYHARLKEREDLAGVLKVKVVVDKGGAVSSVELVEDSVQDAVIEGHVYFALKDAVYPKQKREPTFEFELKPPKKKEP
ncbi:MAG: tetratricopeptide repeat protein [Myxococcaceae bacterium]